MVDSIRSNPGTVVYNGHYINAVPGTDDGGGTYVGFDQSGNRWLVSADDVFEGTPSTAPSQASLWMRAQASIRTLSSWVQDARFESGSLMIGDHAKLLSAFYDRLAKKAFGPTASVTSVPPSMTDDISIRCGANSVRLIAETWPQLRGDPYSYVLQLETDGPSGEKKVALTPAELDQLMYG